MRIPIQILPFLNFLVLLLAGFCLASPVFSEGAGSFAKTPYQIFQLQDGSQIKGRLVGVDGDRYLVESVSMGNVSIHAENVISIVNESSANAVSPRKFKALSSSGAGARPSSDSFSPEEIANMQKTLMTDQDLMSDIQALGQDPAFMELLQDPELMDAIIHHDVEKLRDNPKAQELMQNPKMQAILLKASQKLGVQ